MTSQDEPRTLAGRVLLDLVFDGEPEPNPPADREALLHAILAIEAEAAGDVTP